MNNCPELKHINSEVVEQINYPTNKFKYITKHMDKYHYIFFYMKVFDDMNTSSMLENIKFASISILFVYI